MCLSPSIHGFQEGLIILVIKSSDPKLVMNYVLMITHPLLTLLPLEVHKARLGPLLFPLCINMTFIPFFGA